jgi:hypothetical protein
MFIAALFSHKDTETIFAFYVYSSHFRLISATAHCETDKPIWKNASPSALSDTDSNKLRSLGIEGLDKAVIIMQNNMYWNYGNDMRKFCKSNCSVLEKD